MKGKRSRFGTVRTKTNATKKTARKIYKEVASSFEDFMFDWDYETYLLLGGYGSGKSYHIA